MKELGTVVIIIFIFMLIHIFLSFSVGIANIRNNWSKYKCNPAIMPFAAVFGHDPKENLDACIKLKQADFMQDFLKPIYDSLQYFAENGSLFTNLFEDAKLFGLDNQDAMGGLAGGIGGRLYSVVDAMQLLYTDTVSTVNQLGSVITVLFYMVQTGIGTGEALSQEILGTLIKFGMGV